VVTRNIGSRLRQVRAYVWLPNFAALLLAAIILLAAPPAPDSFRFAIFGDRTGSTEPGVYEQVWREAVADKAAFVVGVGDTIEGLDDASAEEQWRAFERILAPYRRFPLYLAPGNHDIWSEASEKLFPQYSGHPLHYSFDYGPVHVTVLDNSRSDQFSADELGFLDKDLQAHATQPVKFVISHRPSWLIEAVFRNPNFAMHQLARKYGVQYVIAGHVHQLLHVDLEGVTYLSMPSAGGHLRATKRYQDGWFFGYALVKVTKRVSLEIKELKPPSGQGRVTTTADWGMSGLTDKTKAASAGAATAPASVGAATE
jgi:Icc protein